MITHIVQIFDIYHETIWLPHCKYSLCNQHATLACACVPNSLANIKDELQVTAPSTSHVFANYVLETNVHTKFGIYAIYTKYLMHI